ncbi:unnamed protein product [Lampetra planeri]
MVTEKILLLADDLDIAIVAQEDTEMGSLQAARLLHANLLSQRRKASRAAAGRTVAAVTPPTEEVYAADFRQQQREEEAVFRSLRDALVNAPPLVYPDFSKPFVLDTDVSNTGAPGVTGSRPPTPTGDAEGLATSTTDSLGDEHLPPDGLPAGVIPCDGPAARTRAKMCRLL